MKKLLILSALSLSLAASTWSAPVYAQDRGWPEYTIGATTAPVGVRTLQRLLNVRGYRVKIDSVFGAQTRDALLRFQKAKGLEPTGTATGETWEALVVRLKRGSKGLAVRALQENLILAGFKTAQDGVFGRGTESALIRFQKARDLAPDGVAGPQTWSALTSEAAMENE